MYFHLEIVYRAAMSQVRRRRRELDLSIWERLVRYHRSTVSAMDQSLRSTFGYGLDDYDVLHQIVTNGDRIRMGALAERLLLANSSCNRIVGRLVAAGFVVRSRGDVDRREVFVDVTASGRRLHRRMAAVHTRDIERLLGVRLSESSRGGLDAALRDLLDDAR